MLLKFIKKCIKIFAPSTIGSLAVLLAFIIEDIVHNNKSPREDILNSGLVIFIPSTLLAVLVQLIIINPLWTKNKNSFLSFFLKMSTILPTVGGFLFGYFFWVKQFGYKDLIISCLIGFIALLIYIMTNIFTLKLIDKTVKNNN